MLVTHLKFKILQPHFSVTNTMKRLQDNEKTNLRLLKKQKRKPILPIISLRTVPYWVLNTQFIDSVKSMYQTHPTNRRFNFSVSFLVCRP